MKKLILIPILFLSYFVEAQYVVVKPSQLPAASTINPTDLLILNQGTTTKKVTYSILNTVLKDTFAIKSVVEDSIAALRGDIGTGGSFPYYKTLDDFLVWKMKLNTYLQLGDPDENFGLTIGYYGSTNYVASTLKGGFSNLTKQSIVSAGAGGVDLNFISNGNNYHVTQDSSGLHYNGAIPDTTLTTPNHLMTEAQVKREIAAVGSQWTTTSLGIRYDGGGGDSICHDNTGSMRAYIGGVKVYELKSDGTFHQYSGGNEILYTTTKGAIGLKYNSLNNTAIGDSALTRNILGEQNTAIGPFALWYNLIGNSNTAIGSGSLEENLGNNNIAIGNESGRYNTTLSNRIYINSLNRIDLTSDTTKSIIYGLQDATVANQRLYLNAGRVIISGQIKTLQISAALTDNTPTDAEIDTATGLTPATAGAGYQVTIKDNNGTGLLYKIESDGTDWYYTVMTKAI